jgi:hypothetical protein
MEKRQLSTDEIQEILKNLEYYLNDLKTRWDNEGVTEKGWLFLTSTRLVKGTAFIINCLDELVQFVEEFIPNGKDKKAAVMSVLEKLFDYIIYEAFPIWLKPFSPAIKKIALEIIGITIDFIVDKYNAGIWNMEQKENVEEIK